MQQVCENINRLQSVCYVAGTVLGTSEGMLVKNEKSSCCRKFVSYKAKSLTWQRSANIKNTWKNPLQ